MNTNNSNYLQEKVNHWWIPVIMGTLLLVATFYFVMQPVKTFLGLTILFGWLILVNGAFNFVFSLRNKKFFDGWLWYMMIGIIELILGLVLLLQPQLSAQSLILFAGFWMMFTAVSRISFSFVLKKLKVTNWWLTLVSGIITVLFSVLILVNPVFAIFGIVYLISIPIGVSGIMAILIGLQMRKLNQFLAS